MTRVLLCATLCTIAACSQTSITGSTTGTPPSPPQCPANSLRQPDGTCECIPNYTECPGDGGLICSQVLLDNDNCGGCGIVCPNGESCLGGACTCHLTTCTNDGGSVCTDPESDPLNCSDCGRICPFDGMTCNLGICCPPSLTIAYCDGDAGLECVDLVNDDNNCGTCGNVCAPDQHCAAPDGSGGMCVCGVDAGPGTDMQNCDGTCVDITHDTYNCGACGHICLYGPCAPGDAGTGMCGCAAPFELCGPTCVDTRSDFDHCGGCTACSPPATQCVEGMCE